MAYKVFTNGSPLPASDLNTYLMNQSVMVFADSAARSAALTSPTEGMVTYLEDTGLVYVYNGSSWVDINDNSAAIPKSTVTTTGDLIVANGNASVTRLGIGATDTVLKSNGTTAVWGAATPITTQGDLIIGNSSNAPSRLAIGANATVLTSNGTTASWQAAAGGTTNWTKLVDEGSVPTGATTATISFTSGYDKYAIWFEGVSSTQTATFYITMQDGSTNAITLDRYIRFDPQGGTSANLRIGSDTTNEFYGAYLGNASHTISGSLMLSGCTGNLMHGYLQAGIATNNSVNYHSFGHLFFDGTNNDLAAIKFRVDQGNFDGSGIITVYGA